MQQNEKKSKKMFILVKFHYNLDGKSICVCRNIDMVALKREKAREKE